MWCQDRQSVLTPLYEVLFIVSNKHIVFGDPSQMWCQDRQSVLTPLFEVSSIVANKPHKHVALETANRSKWVELSSTYNIFSDITRTQLPKIEKRENKLAKHKMEVCQPSQLEKKKLRGNSRHATFGSHKSKKKYVKYHHYKTHTYLSTEPTAGPGTTFRVHQLQ
jgi:hypothetical protein